MVVPEVERLWDDFSIKVHSLFAAGYRLPLSVHLLAIKKVEDELHDWKDKVHTRKRSIRAVFEKTEAPNPYELDVSQVSATPKTTTKKHVRICADDGTGINDSSGSIRRSRRQSREPAKFRDYDKLPTGKPLVEETSNKNMISPPKEKPIMKNCKLIIKKLQIDTEGDYVVDPDWNPETESVPCKVEDQRKLSDCAEFCAKSQKKGKTVKKQETVNEKEKSVIADHDFMKNLLEKIKHKTEIKDKASESVVDQAVDERIDDLNVAQDSDHNDIQDSDHNDTQDSNHNDIQDSDHSDIQDFDHNDIQSLDHNEIQGLDHNEIQGLDHNEIQGLDHNEIQGLDHNEIQGLDHNEIQGLHHNDVQDLDHDAIQGLEEDTSMGEIVTADNSGEQELPEADILRHPIKVEKNDRESNETDKGVKRHLEIKGDIDFLPSKRKKPVKLEEDFYQEDPTASKMYECDICKEQFAYKYNLSLHIKKEHNSGPLKCPECDRIYKNKSSLKQHLALHNGKAHQCPECNYRVGNRAWLDSHIQAIHRKDDPNSRPHLCSICGAGFVKASTCRRHEQTHSASREKPYACDHCNHKTYTRFLLKAHIRNTHSATYDHYVCNICGAKCKYKQSLAEHQLRHIGARPYACNQCNATFVTKSTLTVHMKIHEAPQHQCHVCQKTFVQKGQLQRHMVIHTGAKNYSCTHCKYRCNLPDNLRKHMKSVHKIQLEMSESHKRVLPVKEMTMEQSSALVDVVGNATYEEVKMAVGEVTYVDEAHYEEGAFEQEDTGSDSEQIVYEYIQADPDAGEVKIEGDVANAVLALAGQNTEDGVIQEIIVQQIEGEDGEYIQQYFTVYSDEIVEGAVQEVEG